MEQKVLPWIKAVFSSLCAWAGISMSRVQEQCEQLLGLVWGTRNRENERILGMLEAGLLKGVCAEAKAREP